MLSYIYADLDEDLQKIYFTKKQATDIARDFQWLKTQNFIYPYSGCKIDIIEPEKIENENKVPKPDLGKMERPPWTFKGCSEGCLKGV